MKIRLIHIGVGLLTGYLAATAHGQMTSSNPQFKIYNDAQGKTGVDVIQGVSDSGSNQYSFYFAEENHGRFSPDINSLEYHTAYELRMTSEDRDQDEVIDDHLDQLIVEMTKSFDYLKLGLGLKKLSWGENTSLPILDITNPRYLGAEKGFYHKSAKISVPMLTAEYHFGDTSLEAFVSSRIRQARLPEEVGGFEVKSPKNVPAEDNIEAGLKVGRRFRNLDLKLHYVHHRPRLPSFSISPFSGNGDLELNDDKINTFGTSLSWAGFEHILRADIRHSLAYPIPGVLQKAQYRDLSQVITGYDYSPNVNTVLGFEVHYDNWGIMPYNFNEDSWESAEDSEIAELYWYGSNIRLNFWQNQLTTQLILLKGFERNDFLARLKTEVFPTDRLSVSLEAQKTSFQQSSPRFVLSEQERVLLGLDVFI
jgi:hypothetical protein